MTTLGSQNVFPVLRLEEDTVDATPTPAGELQMKADTATSKPYWVDDAGNVTTLLDSSTVVTKAAYDAKGDLIAGTAADTAARLPVGTNGQALIAASGETTGLDWGDFIADHGVITYLDATEAAAPSTPASGKVRVYAKTDGRIYSKDDAGVEYGPFDTAGAGAGPLLYIDDTTLHADGDEFSDPTLAAWTLAGGLTTGDVTAITTEPYDATCLDVVFAANGDRMLRTIPSWTYLYLTLHGITNSTPSSLTAAQSMMAMCIVNSSGTGTGICLYNDSNAYLMAVTTYAYASTGPTVGIWGTTVNGGPAASNMPIVLRLRKSGTSIYGGISFNGGLSFKESTARTDANTHDRFGIIRLQSSGGTNPTLRIGRINVA